MAKRRVYESLLVDRVDLVDRGANFDRATGDGSHILLTKRADERTEKQDLKCPSCGHRLMTGWSEGGTTIPNYCPECGAKMALKATTKQEQPPMSAKLELTAEDLNKQITDAVNKALALAEETRKADVAKAEKAAAEKAAADAKAKADVEKSDLEKRLEKAEADAKAAKDAATAEIEKRETAECVKKAESYATLALKADADGALFYRLQKALPEADVARVHEILAAADEAARVGKVFGEKGTGTPKPVAGSAEEQLYAKADELRKADATLSREAAIAKACDLYPDVRRAYNAERAALTGTRG